MTTKQQATVVRPGRFPSKTADEAALEALDELEQESVHQVPGKISDSGPTVKTKAETGNDPAEKKEEEVKLTPIEQWRKNIAAVGLSENDALNIVDAVLRKGYWEKEYTLLPGGLLKIKLRTRDSAHRERLENSWVYERPQSPRLDTLARFELASSLVQWTYKDIDVKFSHPGSKAPNDEQDKAFVERMKFVDETVTDPLKEPIRVVLGKFNQLVWAAMTEGTIEGF